MIFDVPPFDVRLIGGPFDGQVVTLAQPGMVLVVRHEGRTHVYSSRESRPRLDGSDTYHHCSAWRTHTIGTSETPGQVPPK